MKPKGLNSSMWAPSLLANDCDGKEEGWRIVTLGYRRCMGTLFNKQVLYQAKIYKVISIL